MSTFKFSGLRSFAAKQQPNASGTVAALARSLNMQRILLVEDNPGCASFMETILTREGYEVQTALRSRDAFEQMGEQEYDLILTDLVMPELNGMELVRQLHLCAPNTPILVVSATYLPCMRAEILAAGATDGIGKPFSYWDFLQKVHDTLGHRSELVLGA